MIDHLTTRNVDVQSVEKNTKHLKMSDELIRLLYQAFKLKTLKLTKTN